MDRKKRIDIYGDASSTSSVASGRTDVESASSISSTDMVVNPWTGAPWSRRYYEILEKRQRLPVYEFKEELEDKIRRNQIIVVEGETGSGKLIPVS